MTKAETKPIPVRHVDKAIAEAKALTVTLHNSITELVDKLEPVLNDPCEPPADLVEVLKGPCAVEIGLAEIQEAIASATIRIQRLAERART